MADYVNEEWTNFMASHVLRLLRGRHPNAEINPFYTVATKEADAIVLQVQIDLNSDMPRPSFWSRLLKR